MPIVLAGAIEFSATDIAAILGLLAVLAVGHISALADFVLWPFALRRLTPGWAWGFVPLAAPHMAAHALGMHSGWHAGLAGTIGGSVLLAVVAERVSSGEAAIGSVGLLLGHYGVRLLVAWHQSGDDLGRLGARWLLMPIAWAVLPWVHLGTLRRDGAPPGTTDGWPGRSSTGHTPAPPQAAGPPPSSPPRGSGPARLPPNPPTG